MRDGLARFVRAAALAGAAGGALRIVAAFVPYVANDPRLEALYALIDIGLLLGLIGVYVTCADALGAAGLVAFLIALIGLASIVGPDAQAFGIDFYRLGALVFVGGLMLFAVQALRARVLSVSAWLWLASGVATVVVGVTNATLAFAAAGMLLGAGFVAAGAVLLRSATHALAPLHA